MSAATEADPERPNDSKAEASEDAIPESQLQRTDPDSILADEADPDKVLGQESSNDAATKGTANSQNGDENDEAAALKRASAASAIFSHSDSRRQSQLLPSSESKANLAPKAHDTTVAAASSSEMSTEALQAHVKDLSNQVAGLNDKLVKSFNRIADLEDDYSEAQERLASMSTRIKELEKERAEHLAALDTVSWSKRRTSARNAEDDGSRHRRDSAARSGRKRQRARSKPSWTSSARVSSARPTRWWPWSDSPEQGRKRRVSAWRSA